jgi:hypothetical protein
MVKCFVIKNSNAFTSTPFVRKYLKGNISPSVCVVLFSEVGLKGLIVAGVIEPICFPLYTEEDRTAFIRDYIKLIASLNQRYQDKLLWWATDISSKNRYTSPLPELVQDLWEIDLAASMFPGKPLLIILPEVGIFTSLRKALLKRGRHLVWSGAVWGVFWQRVAGTLKRFCGLFYFAARFYARALLTHWVLRHHARRNLSPQKQYYVIKTFSYLSSWDVNGDYTDSLFGCLPRIILKDKNVLVWSYHLEGYRAFIKRICQDKTLAIFPVEFFLKVSDVIRGVFRILSLRIPVKGDVSFRGLDISDVLRHELARTANGIQIAQLLHYDATRNMLKRLRVETFLFSFENNPWERMCVLAFRHYSPLTKLLGYQHSIVPPAALNMFISPTERSLVPLPDKVLTAGAIPARILKQYGDYTATDIVVSCALKYDYLYKNVVNERIRSKRILVILDGTWETRFLVEYVLRESKGLLDHEFVIRSHPTLPWSSLSARFGCSLEGYPNLSLSKAGLQEELKASEIVIYWQSTVSLEAACMGKPVVNFSPPCMLTFDPMYTCNFLRWEAGPKSSLKEILAAIDTLSDKEYAQDYLRVRQFARDYLYPVTPERVKEFLV